ncbi:type I-F CRISPR-associated helicase Cas3f [Methylomonas sp. 2BW1-5-20]|uniref:type I-F CRISPR-associated helicase Cas3f n=1 Tax=Methylomonas sp. 2BW1-5-20 TaxID=3376686 RepID=UPI00404E7285
MMVTFVSQCQKKALARTRRVLDAFANRIGDNTWQTVITEEGLQAVKKLLRKTATKSTAVSCHWLRARSRSELVWIVGNRRRFNSEGIVPVNSTQKTVVNNQWESDWHFLPLIKALTTLAALFHDWGKASLCFQNKLLTKQPPDPLRHEWMSLMLLKAFINGATGDTEWLKRLADGVIDEHSIQQAVRQACNKPMADLPDAAGLIAWLIVTHHKLPDFKTKDTAKAWQDEPAPNLRKTLAYITADWGYSNESDTDRLNQCFEFPHGLLRQSASWLTQLKTAAAKLQACLPMLEQAMADGGYRLVLHYCRLSLMLGDHNYSSQDADKNWQKVVPLYANTDRHGEPKQLLDEHLVRVAKQAATVARRLPLFESEPPPVYDVKRLKQKSADARFRWQEQAAAAIKAWKAARNLAETRFGFFAVNMASTGCGKTLANAKIMQALSKDGESLRYALALGLRTLTLQTGDEYRARIGLDNSELAVIIGSRAVLELHNQARQKTEAIAADEKSGSESAEEWWDDNDVDFDIPDQALSALSTLWTDRTGKIDHRKQKFLYAPVLTCTIDHLMAATETRRGGRYILPSLRLMSSDLVIDEIDDFDGDDLIAIGRLIHLAGMSGCKVMISSATIPPALAEGYFNAYREGWRLFAQARGLHSQIGCAWIDESGCEVATLQNADIQAYRQTHWSFVEKRRAKLQNIRQSPAKRIAEIVDFSLPEDNNLSVGQVYFKTIQQAVVEQHRRHAESDPHSGKRISFGVVRMANIPPCIALTRYLAQAQDWPDDVEIRIMAYHSQQILLLRHEQERHLDAVLKRDQPAAVFSEPLIRHHIDRSQADNLIFILVATPVEEVGRDHDFDWAVVEPSSYRSIIQLAGRVLRHRPQTPKAPNISLLQYNLKALLQGDDLPAFCRPGFESPRQRLATHDLKRLIPSEQLQAITAAPRIRTNAELRPAESLADLEHHCIQNLLTSYDKQGPESLQGWLGGCWWLTALPQHLAPFRQSDKQRILFDVPDEKADWQFVEKLPQGGINVVEGNCKIERVELSKLERERCWLYRDYAELLERHAEKKGWSQTDTALRYGEINVRIDDNDLLTGERLVFAYCQQLGFWKP